MTLRQAQGCVPVAGLCRGHGISKVPFCKWRAKYGGANASTVSQMKAMDRAVARLWFKPNGEGEPLAEADVCGPEPARRFMEGSRWEKTGPSRRREMAENSVARASPSPAAPLVSARPVSATHLKCSAKRLLQTARFAGAGHAVAFKESACRWWRAYNRVILNFGVCDCAP